MKKHLLSCHSSVAVIFNDDQSKKQQRTVLSILLMFFLLCCMALQTRAQTPTVGYSGPQVYSTGTTITPLTPSGSNVSASGFGAQSVYYIGTYGNAIAVDPSGNLFTNAGFGLNEIPVGGGNAVTINTGLTSIKAVATDVAGNVYVADSNTGTITQITNPGQAGSVQTTMVSGLSNLVGLAVGASGTIYTLETNPTNQVSMYPVSGGVVGQQTVMANGFNGPGCIAVDNNGNVYVVGTTQSVVLEIPATNTSYPIPAFSLPTLGTGLFQPVNVAVDNTGNVFVCNFNNSSPSVVRIDNSGGTTAINGAAIAGSFSGCAVDLVHDIVYYTNQGRIFDVKKNGGYYISPALPAGLSFNVNTGIISGTPTSPAPATDYTVTGYNSTSNTSATATVNITVDDNRLTSLALSAGTLSPVFSENTNSYSDQVVHLPSINVTLTPSNPATTVTYNGATITPGTPFTINGLNIGATNTLPIIVTSADGSSNTYSISLNDLSGPTVSYSSPNIYTVGTPISPLTPASNSVSAPSYGTPSVFYTAGNFFPSPIALDASGNVYVGNAAFGVVEKIPAGGGTAITIATPGLNTINGLAFDKSGNLYLADNNTGTITEITNPGQPNSTQTTIVSGLVNGGGVAVDAAGNIYATEINGNHQVYKYTVAGGVVTSTTTIGTGFIDPTGIAVDGLGNVYITDPNQTSIKEIPASNTQYPVDISNMLSVGSGFVSPEGVAADNGGNVLVANYGSLGLQRVDISGAITTLSGTVSDPFGVAVDQSGNVYYTDTNGETVTKAPLNGGFYISLALPGGLSFNNTTGVVSGTPVASSPATNYTVSAYNSSTGASASTTVNIKVTSTNAKLSNLVISTGTLSPVFAAATNNYTAAVSNATASVTVTPTTSDAFATVTVNGTAVATGTASLDQPLNPGTNTIPVIVTSPDGTVTNTYNIVINRLALPTLSYTGPNVYAVGTAIAPLTPASTNVSGISYSAVPTTIFSERDFPSAVAVDAAGNVYVGSDSNVDIQPAGGGASINISTGFSYIGGVALDASGNLYVSDFGAGTVSEITTPLTTPGSPTTLISGLNAPSGLFIDAAGSIYVTETNNADLLKYPVTGGVAGTPIVITNALNSPNGVAKDAAGNLYISDSQFPAIQKIPASITTYPVPSGSLVAVGSGFAFPYGVAVDNTGSVYVSDLSLNTITRIDPTGSMSTIASGLANPSAVAVDLSGNIYIANTNGSDVLEVNQIGGYYIVSALPAGLTINSSTGIISGTPAVASAATNYTITGYNGGGDKTTATVSIQTNLVTPTISYSGPNVYPTGTAITPLAPTSTNVSAFGYGAQTSLYTAATNNIGSITTDKAGNIYTTTGSTVIEIPAVGGAVITVAHGFSVAVGVAVDGLGHIYVTDEAAGKLYKIVNPGAASTDSVMESSLKSPMGLAVDAAGNLYMIENNGGSGRDLKKYTVVNTKITATTTIANVATSGLNSPSGVAIDGAGNIYIADVGKTNILKIPATVTTYPVAAANVVTIGSGFNFPDFVAVDNAGDVFVSDGGNAAIKRVDAGTGNITTINNGVALSDPSGVALDALGNVYYTDDVSNNALEVYEVKQTGGYNISPALPAGLALDNNTGTISGTPTIGSPATIYTVTDINGPSNTNASTTVSIQTINVNLSNLAISSGTLNPVFSGTVSSYSATISAPSITVTPTTSDPAATVTVNGTAVTSGTASASIPMNVGANVVTVVVTGSDNFTTQTYTLTLTLPPLPTLAYTGPYVYPTGTAITPVVPVSSNVAAKAYASQATYVSSVATATTPAIILPTGMATDASGNLYLANWTGSNGPGVVERVPTGAPATYGSGFQQPYNLSTDASGNIYVADIALTSIKKITPGNVVTSIGSGLSFPTGAAVDAAGNIYVSEAGPDDVVKITPAGVKTVLVTGFSSPNDVALDGAGNLYIADGNGNGIYVLAAGAVTPVVGTTLPTIGSGMLGTNSVAVDGSGSVFVAAGNNTLVEISNTGIQSTLASGVSIFGVATDGAGNAYESDNAGAKIYIVKPLGGYFISPALPAGLSFNNNTGVISGTPTAGSPATNYTITAYNAAGATVVTTVNIKTISANAALSNITLSSGTVSPAVTAGTFAYTASVITPSITVTPTTADLTASVTVNGATVASGFPSASIPLSLGSNTINIAVTAGDGTTTQAYTLTVNRGEGLTNLAISSGTLSPVFATATTAYTASVSVPSINVTPTTPDPTAIVTINGTPVASGSPASVALTVGSNTITTIVTSADASVSQTYTTTVTYTPSTVSSLSRITISSGSLSPSFRSTTFTYTASVGSKSFSLTPTTTDGTATIQINGTAATSGTAFPLTLVAGANVINTVVTAAAGGTTTYKLTVTYTPSSTLSGLAINSGNLSPSFQASKTTYIATSTTPAFTVTPTATDGAATITVNGTTATSGTAQAITLTSGSNVINTVVTNAAATPTSTTYKLTVSYTPSTVATLKTLTISQGTLSPNFASATTGYTASVANSVTSINVTPTLTFSGASLTVNGTAATSGSAFNVLLNPGSNTITVAVTAQDGTHTGNYTITVTRDLTPATITFNTLTAVTYGDGDFSPGATSDNTGTAIAYSSDNGAVATIVNGNIHILAAGTANVTASQAADATHLAAADVVQPLTVNQAPLTITADNKTKVYGDALPALTVSYTGLVNGDTPNSLTTQPSITTTCDCTSQAGGYPITASNAVDANYTIGYVGGTLSVTPAPLTITADNQKISQGQQLPTLTFSYNGFVNNDGAGNLTNAPSISTTGTSVSPAGQYPITLSGAVDPNYTISYVNAMLTINSTDALLSNFTISNGTLSPSFSAATTTYTDVIANLTPSITIVPTTDDPNATITVNGSPATSGVRSPAIPMSIGANTLTVVVTAQDGIATQTYTTTINRPLPNNALLTSITLNPTATLVSTTGPGYLNFNAAVANSVGSIQVHPVAQDALATITVNGSAVASGALSQPVTLNVGANTITTVITAQDGVTTKTVIITVTRAPASVASLSNLAISTGTLSPVFAAGTNAYVASVPYAVTSVNFTPTTTDANATITVNGATTASGATSAAIPLSLGANKITTVVTAQNGATKQTYNTTITRLAASTNALLTSIALTPATSLIQTSGAGYLNYSASVGNGIASVQVTPTAADATATITVNGNTISSGALSQPIALNVGANTITTVITAQDGATSKTIIISVTRAASTVASLAGLSISNCALAPAFATGKTSYTASVANATTAVTVTPATSDPTATVTVNGTAVTSGTASTAIPLTVGANTITTVVTAQDGVTIQTYTVTITRAPSADALLTSIKLNPAANLTIVAGPGYVNYITTVASTTTSVTVTATEQDATATIKVNGNVVASGVASVAIPLSIGSNVINIVSTAQDGVTSKTYTITATRAISTNAGLAALKLSSGILAPVFATGTINYTATVTNTTNAITVTPTTSDATATVIVNGTTVTSGSASTGIPLTVGQNTVTTTVTAQDASTTKTYTIIVTRAASTDALLTSIKLAPAANLTIVTGPSYVNYTTSVANTVSSVTVTATEQDLTAVITVNGITTASGAASQPIALNVGSNVINIVSTAQDGVTSKTYTITATRAAPTNNSSVYEPISVTKPADNVSIADDGVMVHQAVSPNGDGVNDYLTIDGIANYPDNRLMIVDRNGAMVYQTKGYDNNSRSFDGHSNINGKMQLPGTYFYSLDYTVNGENKHKTGYIILKY